MGTSSDFLIKINNMIRYILQKVLIGINLENGMKLGKTIGKEKSCKGILSKLKNGKGPELKQ